LNQRCTPHINKNRHLHVMRKTSHHSKLWAICCWLTTTFQRTYIGDYKCKRFYEVKQFLVQVNNSLLERVEISLLTFSVSDWTFVTLSSFQHDATVATIGRGW